MRTLHRLRTKADALIDVVPPPGAARRLVAVSLVDAIGSGFFIAGSALFFVRVLGLSASEVGVGLALSALVGFLTTVPLGMLSDRLGPRGTLVVLHLWRAGWTAVLPLCDGVVSFTAVAGMLAIAECAIMPLTRTLVSDVMGAADRTRTLGFMRSWRNAGFAVGAALTAPLIAFDTRSAYVAIVLANAVTCALAALVVLRIGPPSADTVNAVGNTGTTASNVTASNVTSPPTHRGDTGRRGLPRALLDRPYVALALVDAALMTHTTLLTLGIPLWIGTRSQAPDALIPLLVVLNTCLAVALQVRFASEGESVDKSGRALRRSGICLASGCALIAFSGAASPGVAVALLVLAVLALTAAELWEAAGSWALSYHYAPADREGEYLSVFSLGSTAQYVVAPVVLTSFVLDGDAIGWLVLAGGFVLVSLAVSPVVAWLERPGSRTGAALGRPIAPSGLLQPEPTD